MNESVSDETEIVIHLTRKIAVRLLYCLQHGLRLEPGASKAILVALEAALKS